MIKVLLIRHSKTIGNINKRYIGVTDEHLCDEGISLIKSKQFPEVDKVYSSPLLRCIETSKLIYPDKSPIIVENLKECNFGDFENKNYKELSGNKDYQKWIDSNGELPFPNGEDIMDFKKRSIVAFKDILIDSLRSNDKSIALIIHGGTIMAILDKYSYQHKDYYEWQVNNCCGYQVEINESEQDILVDNIKAIITDII